MHRGTGNNTPEEEVGKSAFDGGVSKMEKYYRNLQGT